MRGGVEGGTGDDHPESGDRLKLTKKQLSTAHYMEAEAILAAGAFLKECGKDSRGMMTLMLALKLIQDEYPNLYPNVANAPQIIHEWIITGSKELPLHPMFVPTPAGKRLLNFPEHNETKH